MINEHGVLHYREPDMNIASFPENIYFQAGVSYMRDHQYRKHPGFEFVEYMCNAKTGTYTNHIYIQAEAPCGTHRARLKIQEDAERLFFHWCSHGYSYSLINIGDPDATEEQTPVTPPQETPMPKPNAHHPELDNMSPAQIRVLCEELLYTMDTEQRRKIMGRLPGIYHMAYPGSTPVLKP
jgi:hypothetical protein